MKNKIEGYWYDKYNPQYPKPIPQKTKCDQEFISKLKSLEERAAIICYRGSSNCRICNIRNGSKEYMYGGWNWPSGYMHYITEHNIHPSEEFRKFVEGIKNE